MRVLTRRRCCCCCYDDTEDNMDGDAPLVLAPSSSLVAQHSPLSPSATNNLGLPPMAQPPSLPSGVLPAPEAATAEAHPSTDESGTVSAVPLERPPLPPPPSESELRPLKMMELRAMALDMGIDADTVENVRR